jgi:dihydroorotate dehydrogenase (NAD+) catalytic subunit
VRTRRGPFDLGTPVILASGPAGFGFELEEALDYASVGALTTKTVTPRPRIGNPQPRLVDCAGGLLNSIGLENPGFERFINDILPDVLDLPTRHIISLAATEPEELARMVATLPDVPSIDAIELNLSCPNVEAVVIGSDPDLAGSFVRAARVASAAPLIAKLPGDAGNTIAASEAVLGAGADGLTLVNSVRGLRIDHRIGRPMLERVTGGLCGPAILPIALARVYEARNAFPDAFIVGTGGVTDLESLIEMLAAGADAVGIGYGIMANPSLPMDLSDGLALWLAERGFTSLDEVIGAAHRGGFLVP